MNLVGPTGHACNTSGPGSQKLLLTNPLYFAETMVLTRMSLKFPIFQDFIFNSTGKNVKEGGKEGEGGFEETNHS